MLHQAAKVEDHIILQFSILRMLNTSGFFLYFQADLAAFWIILSLAPLREVVQLDKNWINSKSVFQEFTVLMDTLEYLN